MHSIIDRLHVCADLCDADDPPERKTVAKLQRLAAAEIRRLQLEVAKYKAEATVAKAVDPRVGASDLSFADRMNACENQIADVGTAVVNAHNAMRECASNDKLHASVRFLADTLAINLRGVATTPIVADTTSLSHCYPAESHVVTDDANGTLRYRKNRIVDDLVMAANRGQKGPDLNQIAIKTQVGEYSEAERAELYRIIGYSLSGFDDVFPNVSEVDRG